MSLYVKDIMTREIRTLDPDKTVGQAARAMIEFNVGSLVIVKKGRPVGIVTEGDVSRAAGTGLDMNTTKVRSIMSKNLVTTLPEERVEGAAKLMAEANVKKLPVVDGAKLVGMVTQTDIVASSFELVTSLKEMVRARYRPPDFQP